MFSEDDVRSSPSPGASAALMLVKHHLMVHDGYPTACFLRETNQLGAPCDWDHPWCTGCIPKREGISCHMLMLKMSLVHTPIMYLYLSCAVIITPCVGVRCTINFSAKLSSKSSPAQAPAIIPLVGVACFGLVQLGSRFRQADFSW